MIRPIAIFLVFGAAVSMVTASLLKVQQQFLEVNETRGGADSVNVDLVNYWGIDTEELRNEDPQGFAELAAMEHTPERTRLVEEWSREVRQTIFTRRYGYEYTGDGK